MGDFPGKSIQFEVCQVVATRRNNCIPIGFKNCFCVDTIEVVYFAYKYLELATGATPQTTILL